MTGDEIINMIPTVSSLKANRTKFTENAVREIVQKINYQEERGQRNVIFYLKPNQDGNELKTLLEVKGYSVKIKIDSDPLSGESKYLNITWE